MSFLNQDRPRRYRGRPFGVETYPSLLFQWIRPTCMLPGRPQWPSSASLAMSP